MKCAQPRRAAAVGANYAVTGNCRRLAWSVQTLEQTLFKLRDTHADPKETPMNRRPLLRCALLGLALALPFAARAQSALDEVMARKQINIAVPTDFPPYGFVSTDLKPQGLDVDMANYIGAKLGVKVELVPVTSANRIAYLQTKKADLVIPERER